MVDGYTSQDLLRKALILLSESYDSEDDSFFVVVTKDGKDANSLVGQQAIVGELNLKTVVAFIVQAIHQLCESSGADPYSFISRHIMSHFIDEERAILRDMMISQATLQGRSPGAVDSTSPDYLDEEDEDEEYEDQEVHVERNSEVVFYVTNPSMSEVDN